MTSPRKAAYKPVSDHFSDQEPIAEDDENDSILLQPLSKTHPPSALSGTSSGHLAKARYRAIDSPTRKNSENRGLPSPRGSQEFHHSFTDEEEEDEDEDEDEDSPARLVAKVVPETDDPTLTTSTIRVWLIGSILGGIGAGINQIFFFKSNGVGFGGFFTVLVSFPMGKLLARILPDRKIWLPNPFGWCSNKLNPSRWLVGIELNPGEFSIKEHILIGVLSGCASSAAYAGDIVAVQDLYYHQDMGHFGSLLLILSTQLLGFGLAGFTYSILIRPTAMLWPSSLVAVTLYNTLHSVGSETAEGRKLTRDRMRFFTIVFIGIFFYQFIPSVMAPTLTSISVLCIINNQDAFMRVLGSALTITQGLLSISLDWTVIGSAGPLFTPFFPSLNFFVGMIITMWFLVPLMWYTDFWNNRSFGDNAVSARLYDSRYQKYNVSAVVKSDFTLDEAKFEELGPIQLTPYFALSYGISFAVLTSAVVTVFLFHWNDVRAALAERNQRSNDIHVELVERNYGNVPWTWYAWVGGSMFLASIFVVVQYPLQCPVWALLLALGMSAFFIIPIVRWMGFPIKATTNTQIGLNVITEFVAGLLLPGRPLANITFKVYGYMTMSQCLDLAGDLKMGIYAKIPPKAMFSAQVIGTSVGAVINYVFIRSVIADKRSMLDGTVEDPTGQWTGRKPEIFYSASVIWGLIGPIRFFAGKYRVLFWGFPIGVLLPFIPWFLAKRYPKVPWKNLSIPLLLHGSIIPPQIPTNIITCGLLAAFLSQYWALRYRSKWFEKYNYVLSSALDAGSSINALTIYVLGLQGAQSWWNPLHDAEHCKVGS
ncbi:hypothetical protein CROQUDRAFT_45326 [Cronartium quercuum f. sp. fusiforme G11]|uniref:OPT family small oligopeptide transporter n=1 Tax=Cronartium quercuum f. sp. fusiforme G11 TaxID=708437 RepID=A0A9P6TBJ7_9BASI|nr:hypothetical protein CROQUDRAFT_45326 [Cronartium quercuum f. sp. fusiforme G11]